MCMCIWRVDVRDMLGSPGGRLAWVGGRRIVQSVDSDRLQLSLRPLSVWRAGQSGHVTRSTVDAARDGETT